MTHPYFQGHDIKKPKSAIMLQFFFSQKASFSKSFQQTISLSEIDPQYKLLIKVTALNGETLIKPLYHL